MLSDLTSTAGIAFGVLIFCFILVLVFEFTNGFHDTANAVATVIYTHSLKAVPAVILSGTLNFLGVLLGGIAVAFTLVELLPPDVLTPPNGNPAIAMLLALFLGALVWNVGTWLLGIPCSSSHAVVGALIGVAIGNSIVASRGFGNGVDWGQIWSVLKALLISPVMGFIGAGLLFRVLHMVLKNKDLFKPTEGKAPVWWVRGLLILTCSGVSFAHGSNDGQKSIGLIMLTVIGLLPAQYTLNPKASPDQIRNIEQIATRAPELIGRLGDDEKQLGVAAANQLASLFRDIKNIDDIPDKDRSSVRNDIYRVDAELKHAAAQKDATADDKKLADQARGQLRSAVEYAPVWVRVLSALCLGLGTMVGYKRIVTTIGEKIGKEHLSPAQGASAELVGALLIGTAGFSGLPVSTTHIISSGVAGTMVGSGSGVQGSTMWQIVAAWVLTLPATILLSGGLFMLFAQL